MGHTYFPKRRGYLVIDSKLFLRDTHDVFWPEATDDKKIASKGYRVVMVVISDRVLGRHRDVTLFLSVEFTEL